MDFILKNAKSIVAFIVTALAQGVTDRVNTGQGLPQTPGEWAAFLGISFAAAVVVWITGNKQDGEQVADAMRKLPQHEKVEVAQKTLDSLPDPVSDKVVREYPRWNTIG